MRDLLKRLTRMVIGYGAVQWAGPFLSLIFTPIITRALTPADYGVADYLLTLASAFSTLALFALPTALLTHFNDQPDDPFWRRAVTGSAYTIATISGLACGAWLLVFAPTLTARVSILAPYTSLVQLIGATFFFGVTGSILLAASQAALRVRWGMVFSLVTLVGTFAGNIAFVVILRLGVTGMILTPIVTGLATWLVGMVLVRGMLGLPNRRVTKMLLRSGGILLPTMLAAWALQVSDRLFLGQYVGEAGLGYYAIANRMAGLVGVAMAPIYAAWTPLALAMQQQTRAAERYISMSRYLIAAVLMIGLGISLFATEILIILTRPAYLPAAPYVGFLVYMHIFSGFGAVFSTGALLGKQLASFTGAVVIGAIVNMLLNILLIPRYGVWGATLSTVIGYALPQIILYLVLQQRFPIAYPIGRFLAALGIEFVLMLIGLLLPATNIPLRVGLKLLLFAVLPLSYLWLGLISVFEAQQARLFVRHRVGVALGAWRKR